MPASRRARAMILAPRSWPSSPGLATTTRILLGAGEAAGVIAAYIMRRRHSAPAAFARVAAFAHDPPERSQGGAGADRGEHLQAAAEAIEVEHLPAFFGGDAPQVLVGVDDYCVAHGAQHRQI